jgi:hypothetical protein
MTERDDKVARLYGALPKEEPPESLDAAILAAARRAAVRPSLARRWAVPVSLAAVLVLAIGVTLEIRDEAPGIEVPTASPATRSDAAAPANPREEKEAPRPATPRMPESKEEHRLAPPLAAHRRVTPAKPAPTASTAAPQASQAPPAASTAAPQASQAPPAASNVAPAQVTTQPSSAAGAAAADKRLAAPAAAPSPPAADLATQAARVRADDPIASLEAIAKLRAAGRDAEADHALDDFRRRFPIYRIDDATWERVKPR